LLPLLAHQDDALRERDDTLTHERAAAAAAAALRTAGRLLAAGEDLCLVVLAQHRLLLAEDDVGRPLPRELAARVQIRRDDRLGRLRREQSAA
jgi:hypothetical protein